VSEELHIDDDDGALNGAVVTQFEAPVYAAEEDLDALYGEHEATEDLPAHIDHAFEVEADDRVAKLEDAVRRLADEQVARENKRVRRKVVASSGGSVAAGITPIVLQLAGMLDMDPEVASAVAAIAAALGALLVGYLTPERKAPISPAELI
jgi:hypothetical protein